MSLKEWVETVDGQQAVENAAKARVEEGTPAPTILESADQGMASASALAGVIASLEIKKQLGTDSGRGSRDKITT